MYKEDPQLAKIDEKMEQLRLKKRQLAAQKRKRKLKERNRMLIKEAAIYEKHFGIKGIEQVEIIAKNLAEIVNENKSIWLQEANHDEREK